MNVSDIKLALDEMGVTYPEDAKKAELEALLQEAQEAAAALAASTPTENAESSADAPAAPSYYVTHVISEGGLNVRDAPDGAAMFVAPCSTEVTVFAEDSDGWARIGIEGWVRREFLG